MFKHIAMTFVAALCILTAASAQDKQVKGTVTDVSGAALPGVSVLVDGTLKGAITDVDGSYSVNCGSKDALVFSFFGMKTQRIEVGDKYKLDVVMEEDSFAIEGTVVTAMGITRSEKTLGYAATTVKSDEISNARLSDVSSALAGKVAGLQIQSTSSDPGAATSVTIRGFSSINGSNQPLYVVDGIPLSTQTSTSQGHAFSTGGVANIAPDDIESMTILKGAAATALYGSRAANGVIIITTKVGKKGADRDFSIDYNGGVQFRQIALLPKLQNLFGQGWNGSQTFIENGSWGPRFDGTSVVPFGPVRDGEQLHHLNAPVKNNVKDFYDIGVAQNHSIAFSGASVDHRMTYYASYSYSSDDGIVPSKVDTYKRNTIAFRGSYEPTDWLKVSSQMNLATSKTSIAGSHQGTSVINGLLELPRDMSLKGYDDLTNPFHTPEAYFTPYGNTNPYWAIKNNYNHTAQKQVFGKLQIDAKPIKELTLTYRFSFDYSDYDRKVGTPEIDEDWAMIDDYYGAYPGYINAPGSVYVNYYRRHELNHDVLASYNKNFFNDRFSVLANVGGNMNERYSTYLSGSTSSLTFKSGFWDLSNGATIDDIYESQSKRRIMGLFGDVTLGWDDTVFIEYTARNDWSSTLPIKANSFFYQGVTGSYIFTNHLPKNNILTFGKIRAAYGKTGNDADVYLTNPIYTQASSFPISGINAFQRDYKISSVSLQPEMTTEFELGANLQFFNGRVGIDASYYNRLTKDQIFDVSIDPMTGYSTAVTNFGDVRNRGYELLFNFTPIQTKTVRWDIDVNFSQNFSKVVSLPEGFDGKVSLYGYDAGSDGVYMYAEVGKPLGTYWAYLPTTVTDKSSPYYGSFIVDSAGQPVLTPDMEPTGFTMNNKWVGGITTSLSVKNFTLSATLDVRSGGKMFSRSKEFLTFTGGGRITTYNERRPLVIPNSVYFNGTSYEPNTQPLYSSDQSYQNWYDLKGFSDASRYLLIDRSFTKLRNITLSYNLPKKIIGPFQNIGVSVFCNNPFTWTASDNQYVDPESTTTGSDLTGSFGEALVNPSCRIYGFNVNIKF